MHGCKALVLTSITIATLTALGACAPQPQYQGNSGLIATYKTRTLVADLPASASVPAVIAAAQDNFIGRGYSIPTSSTTDDVGMVVGIPPRTSDFPRVVVRATAQGDHTHVEIINEPLPDQSLARSVLDGILEQLGL
ncbi:MAG: hypothetical protein AB7Q00_12175 [Phycisphaerales bacterium]|nr:MAG: hypothetical protein IPK69_13075 [Phycisphaerales bacterium]